MDYIEDDFTDALIDAICGEDSTIKNFTTMALTIFLYYTILEKKQK